MKKMSKPFGDLYVPSCFQCRELTEYRVPYGGARDWYLCYMCELKRDLKFLVVRNSYEYSLDLETGLLICDYPI